MGKRDKRIDAYIANAADLAKPILIYLRELVHEGCPEVEETMKWSFPHFMFKGILCSMAAFKQPCAFTLWKGKLILPDEKDGAMGQFGRITAISDLPPKKVLLQYIRKAADSNISGASVPRPARSKVKKELVVPDYFRAALKKNPKALTTFENFSYSHKKEYVQWITEAKREDTRDRRIKTAIDQIAVGKSRHWEYQRC
jgi:uncharacterized protein YdeI (YjbR/CyaY-like superfamily)